MSWFPLWSTLGLWAIGASPALAGVPVVHDGEDAVTRAALVDQTGLPASQFDLLSLREARKLAPRVVGAATLRHCSGSPTRAAELRALQVRAESALRDGEASVAQDHLDLAIAGLGCLSEPVEAKVGARLLLLRGVAMAQAGDAERARAELQTALALDPEVKWLEGLAEEHAILLEETRATTPSAELTISPPPRGATPWVDGKPVKVGVVVRPGLHLVQVPSTSGLRSAWMTIHGDAALVVLEGQRPQHLAGIAAKPPDRHAVWLLDALAEEPSVYVVHKGGIWLAELEGERPVVSELRPPAATAVQDAEPEPSGRKKKRRR